MEIRICMIGLIGGIICAVLAWLTHAWYYEVGAILGVLLATFGSAYLDD